MRVLFDLTVDDISVHGYTQEEFVNLTTDLIKKYWFDEGIVFDDKSNSITTYYN